MRWAFAGRTARFIGLLAGCKRKPYLDAIQVERKFPMTSSPAFASNPGHKITIAPELERVVVRFKGEVVADTKRAVRLQEASYPSVLYIPRDDIKAEHFIETSHQTKCPFKGTARYWTLTGKSGEAVNAVWGYDNPFDQVAGIDQHVAFYPNQVEIKIG
jgi:uncharacterized protein (DUF427 family)